MVQRRPAAGKLAAGGLSIMTASQGRRGQRASDVTSDVPTGPNWPGAATCHTLVHHRAPRVWLNLGTSNFSVRLDEQGLALLLLGASKSLAVYHPCYPLCISAFLFLQYYPKHLGIGIIHLIVIVFLDSDPSEQLVPRTYLPLIPTERASTLWQPQCHEFCFFVSFMGSRRVSLKLSAPSVPNINIAG